MVAIQGAGADTLTDNERAVAKLVADGLTNAEIAHEMYLSRHTIDYHLRQVYRKLDISSRVQLTRIVVQQGL